VLSYGSGRQYGWRARLSQPRWKTRREHCRSINRPISLDLSVGRL